MNTAAGLTLLAALVFGHGLVLTYSHNRWYGSGFHKYVIDALQLLHGLLLLGGPIGLVLLYGLDPYPIFVDPLGGVGPALLAAYCAACLAALPLFVALTLWRRLRSKPAALVSNHTRTVDVAAELGYQPLGQSPHGWMARLPRNEVFQVDLAEKTVRLRRLPKAWDHLSILHVSDVHWNGTPDRVYFRRVMDLCAEWKPDLVAFTGDAVDTDGHYRWIVPLFGRLKWKDAALAILGNHDAYFDPQLIRRRLGKLGMQVLGNSWKQIEIRGEPMVVIGNEAPWFGPPPNLSACPAEIFRLCLSHTPDHIGWAKKHGIDLVLAGHVHGGQLRLPAIGSIVVPSRYGRRYDCGLFDESPTVMHVSRGLSGEQPLRYNCRPEVTKLILRCAEPSPAVYGSADDSPRNRG
jgi:predicted MPP superfamily phosphohydrolase